MYWGTYLGGAVAGGTSGGARLVGETLSARLEKGALPLEQTLEFAVQIADALDKAPRQGVAHRDLKPGNIMLTKSGAKAAATHKADSCPMSERCSTE